MKYDVYLAAPFFCQGEREHNQKILSALESHSVKVFYPYRDGVLAKEEISKGKPQEEVFKRVWSCDTEAIADSHTILAVLDGRAIDEGVCIEIGYGRALNKLILGYHTDNRTCFMWGMNPMVSEALSQLVTDIPLAVKYILQQKGKCLS